MQHYLFEFNAMGTVCSIQMYAGSKKQAQSIANQVIADVNRLENKYSRYRGDSFLSQINRVAASSGKLEVDEETAGVLNYAETCFQQSDGLFDITSGVLKSVWNFNNQVLPDQTDIDQVLKKIGWRKLNWNSPCLEFPVAGLELDFGGIVKEYAVDRAAVIAQSAGMHHGLINLGGDIRVTGPQVDEQPWQIGIQHPRREHSVIKQIELYEGALASSGDYARCIHVNGQRYGHVFNPITGWPVSHMAATSVVSDFCVVAGSAATIAMLKQSDGPAWLNSLGLPCLWVGVQGQSGGSLNIEDKDES